MNNVNLIGRFPGDVYKVYRYNAVLDPLITALLGAFDTRNRIIEVETSRVRQQLKR